jgi:two-component system KDP operon response regulator KdpE
MSLQVLVVEDDRSIREMICRALVLEGFSVRTAVSLSEAAAMVAHATPDLMLLDLGLPDGDGVALLQRIRVAHNFAVLVVSARHQEAQKVQLLDAGADDYLVKPFSVVELLARIRVALRHRGTTVAAAITRHALDGLVIDLEMRQVYLHGQAQHLTPTEFKLLARLLRSAGKVVTHRQLLCDVWVG